MKRKIYQMIETTFMMMTLACMTGCDNVDNVIPYEESHVALYGEWWLVGWNHEGIRYEVNSNYVGHRHFSIEIPREGSVKAYSLANEATLGEMTVKGNQLLFSGERGITKVGCDIMESNFFDAHILNIKSYQLDRETLRLFYSDKDFFEFTCHFDDIENK